MTRPAEIKVREGAKPGAVKAEQYWFEDFTPGRQFPGASHTLGQAAFMQFAEMTGDAHPLHYDAEYAKKTQFGKPLAHGLLLMSMTALGATPLSNNVEDSMVAFLEQGGKFLKPVLLGDTVTPVMEVEEAHPTSNPANGIVRFAVRLTNQRSEVVLAGFHTYLIKRRPKSGGEMSAVYRNFSQAGLDAAYNNRAAEPGLDAIKDDWERRSKALYARAKVDRDLAYGSGARQRLDFFHAPSMGRPTVAWIHGGYWQTNEKEPNAFIAEGLLAHDLNVALIEYTLAPAASLGAIVAEIRASVAWLMARLQPELGASRRLVVAGHSAGGHLTALSAGLPGVSGALPISGLFDLEPIRLSYLNVAVKMDLDEAGANSPIRLPLPSVPMSIAVGGAELPELIRQTEDYAGALVAAGRQVRKLLVPKATHFTILEEIARPSGTLAMEAARLAEM